MVNMGSLGQLIANNGIIFCGVCVIIFIILGILTKNPEAGGKFLFVTLIGFTGWYIYTHFIATGLI